MDVSQIVAEHGAKFKAGQAGPADLIMMLMQGSETEKLFPLIPTEDTVLNKASAQFSRVLQAFHKKFTALNGTTFKPRKIELQWLKIDASEFPDDIVKSWLGWMAGSGLDRKDWYFTKWWLLGLLKQAASDLEKEEIFWGVPATPDGTTANDARENMLGIRKQLNDGETGGTVNAIAMGAVPTTDAVLFVKYMETMFKSIPELVRSEIDGFQLRPELEQLYKEGMRELYNTNYPQVTDLAKIIDTNVVIRGLVSHTGSDKIWATPLWNRARGVKNGSNESIFRVYAVDREVRATTDYHKGVGFWINEYVYTNGQDNS